MRRLLTLLADLAFGKPDLTNLTTPRTHRSDGKGFAYLPTNVDGPIELGGLELTRENLADITTPRTCLEVNGHRLYAYSLDGPVNDYGGQCSRCHTSIVGMGGREFVIDYFAGTPCTH